MRLSMLKTLLAAAGVLMGGVVCAQSYPAKAIRLVVPYPAGGATDGYTLLLGDAGTYAFNPTLYKKLSYDPVKDFAPISLTGRFALILAVNPSTMQAKSVAEFVDAAKRQPGKIDYGAPGPGSPIHLAMEFFKQRAGIVMTPIPYK